MTWPIVEPPPGPPPGPPPAQPRCRRCLDLTWVPARHPFADPDDAEVMPCPDCRRDEAIGWLKRQRASAGTSSLHDRVHTDPPIRLGGPVQPPRTR